MTLDPLGHPSSLSPAFRGGAFYCRRQLLANAAIAAYLVLRRRGLLVRPPIPRSPIGWRAGRPREFLQIYRPRRAANRCDRGGAASVAPRIRGEGGAQSLPTPRLRECRHRCLVTESAKRSPVELYEPH